MISSKHQRMFLWSLSNLKEKVFSKLNIQKGRCKMLVLFCFIGLLISFFFIVALIEQLGGEGSQEKRMRQDRALRQYKISIGADPTFDEHGNLRK